MAKLGGADLEKVKTERILIDQMKFFLVGVLTIDQKMSIWLKHLNDIQVLGKTEAEEAFRPWWDKLSDYVL